MEAGKLEHEHADVRPEWFARLQECLGEQVGVQEMLIGLAGAGAKAGEMGKLFDRNGVGHLEGKLKTGRHLGNEVAEIICVREFVVGGVHANGFEHLGVFGQAVLFKA